MKVATGMAMGSEASADLAAVAVTEAMQLAGIEIASSVLLFLTSEFASDPMPALRAAAKAASCTQVMGCSASGIFTEQDWVLDAPAAAAMVFGSGVSLQTPSSHDVSQWLLALAAPNAINTLWMATPGQRFGGISGDATGQGPFSVWQSGRGAPSGHCEAELSGLRGAVASAHGLRFLGVPQRISRISGYDVQSLDSSPALQSLKAALETHFGSGEDIPLHRLMAVYAEDAATIAGGEFRLASLVSSNEGDDSVTLAKALKTGQMLCWAVRERDAALADLEARAAHLAGQLGTPPAFGLLFSCLGRGPYFYAGIDKDLELLKEKFPGMPIIGFYGNGEIACINGQNELLQYSAVLGLFAEA